MTNYSSPRISYSPVFVAVLVVLLNPGHLFASRKVNLSPRSFSFLGDSRMAELSVQSDFVGSVSGFHWFNSANALTGHTMKIVGNYAIAGATSDRFLSDVIMSEALNDIAEFVVIGGPLNGISQTSALGSYVNSRGLTVTQENVGDVAADAVIEAVMHFRAHGKSVVLVAESGSTSFKTQPPVRAVSRYNQRIMNFQQQNPGVYYWDITAGLWDSTPSDAVVFLPGLSDDGTHLNVLGAYVIGKAFASWISQYIGQSQTGLMSSLDQYGSCHVELITNPDFQRTAGGAWFGQGKVTGDIPASYVLNVLKPATTASVFTEPNSAGFGNDLVLSLNAAEQDTVQLDFTPSPDTYLPGDSVFQAMDVAVQAGSTNFTVCLMPLFMSEGQVPNVFDLFTFGDHSGPSEAYRYYLRTIPFPLSEGVTTAVTARLAMRFAGPGSATVRLSRPSLQKIPKSGRQGCGLPMTNPVFR